MMNVAFTVRNAGGDLVRDLSKADFEVFDDGAPQSIAFFSPGSDLPLTLGLIADMSGSQSAFLKQHHHDLKNFLKDVLRPQDRAFLIGFGNRVRLVSDFTPSRDRLLGQLKKYEKDPGEFPEMGPAERRILGTAFYDAIYYAATLKLAPVENGRKAIIVFSDGEDNSSAHHMLESIEAAQSSDAVVFAVRYTERKHGRLNARNKYGIGVMARLSRETGGRDFDAEADDLRQAFREIGGDLRFSYELAYYPSTPSDGTFHKVVIRPKRPDLKVRAKSGYYAGER